jgi:hypothetical protein
MIRLLTKDGRYIRVLEALSAEVEGEYLVCRDGQGRVVARFPGARINASGDELSLRVQEFESEQAGAPLGPSEDASRGP